MENENPLVFVCNLFPILNLLRKISSGCNQKRTDQYVSSLIRRDHGRPFCVHPIANIMYPPKSTWAGPQIVHDAPHPPLAPNQILWGNLSLPESGRIRIVPIFDLSHSKGWIHKNLNPRPSPAPLFDMPTKRHPPVQLSGVGAGPPQVAPTIV